MKQLLLLCLFFTVIWANAQTKHWTEEDRQYQLQNFKRTQDLLVSETTNLTDEQWHFRGTPGQWSIAEVVEHLGLWEVIFTRDINIILRNAPNAALQQACRPDSSYLNFIMEEKQHNSPDYSKPSGFIRGRNNLDYFLHRRAMVTRFVDTTTADLRLYHQPVGGGIFRDVHQILLVDWGHVDRHLRQIRRVKEHALFPKDNRRSASN
jgi:hypothetical protein